MPIWATVLAAILTGTGAVAGLVTMFVKRFEQNARQDAVNELKEHMAAQALKGAKAAEKVFANKSTIEQSIADMEKGDF